MRISSGLLFIILPCTGLLLPTLSWPHGGGLDSHGCHHDRKAGGYHCHQGPLAGQEFTTEADMLKALQAQQEKKELPKAEQVDTVPTPGAEPKGAALKTSPSKAGK